MQRLVLFVDQKLSLQSGEHSCSITDGHRLLNNAIDGELADGDAPLHVQGVWSKLGNLSIVLYRAVRRSILTHCTVQAIKALFAIPHGTVLYGVATRAICTMPQGLHRSTAQRSKVQYSAVLNCAVLYCT